MSTAPVKSSTRTLPTVQNNSRKFLWSAMLLATIAPFTSIDTAMAAASSPVVTEAFGGNGVPVTVGSFNDVDAIGYEVREFFVAGGAHLHVADQKLTKDGKWSGTHLAARQMPYKTRVVVYTPKDKSRFNGTVYVEWQNNSGMTDAAPDWVHGHIEVARQGAAYILASVQPIGIKTLKAQDPWWIPSGDLAYPVSDPARYASLKHPGKKYCFDIYSQIAQAVLDGNLLGELAPQHVIGVGESQSASWLTTYINGAQPVVDVYDGFLVHSSLGVAVPLASSLNAAVGSTKIRDDLVPVILLQTETDVQLGANITRQPEAPDGKFRLWEVAGTAHYDAYGLEVGTYDTGAGEGEIASLEYLKNPVKDTNGGIMKCANGINSGPAHWVINAALNSLDRWVRDGTPPPIAPRLETNSPLPFLTMFVADEHGNTKGGIRSPFVDAPVATLTGFGNQAAEGAPFISAFCGLFGQTIPFAPEKLAALYPSNADYVAKFEAATEQAVQAGFLLQEDADLLQNAAQGFDVAGD